MPAQPLEYLSDPLFFREKEQLYLKVRQQEGRILDDAAVSALPDTAPTHPHAREWRWRKRTFLRFQDYLQAFSPDPLNILDLGCGNGWMANRLAENPSWTVMAADLNKLELEQGARLFGRENLHFFYADIAERRYYPGMAGLPFRDTFHVIVLAASVQYFPDLGALLAALKDLLRTGGEIHLLDTHFYPNEPARAAARERTRQYYAGIGLTGMADYYHHHMWPEARQLGGEDLNRGLGVRFLQKTGWLSPFPWIRFRPKALSTSSILH